MNESKPNLPLTRALTQDSISPMASNPETLGDPALAGGTAPVHVGEYILLGELGRGGMGVVYRAEDPRLKREIALKVMLPQYAANEQAKARFVREARAQAKVEHDHVAAIFTVADHNGLPYIVMPLLKGMTLQAALKANTRPPLNEVIRIGREIAEGLAAAHEKGLVHRDIKPANVWLEGKKLRVKVLDFGLARAADTDAESVDGLLTHEGAIVGTPAYMSPEQGRGDPVDGRTDLWSLGVILYQMTAGELPFRGASALVVLSALAMNNPPPPIAKNAAVPQALSDFVMRLLTKDPAHRPPTAEMVADELRSIEAGLVNAVRVIALDAPPPIILPQNGPDPFAELDATDPSRVAEATVVEPAESPRRKTSGSFPMWAVVAVVLLAVAGVVGFVVSQFGSKPPEVAQKEEPPTPKKEVPPVTPIPKDKVTPLKGEVVLFDGKDVSQWRLVKQQGSRDRWFVKDDCLEVNSLGGNNIASKQLFGDCEIHVEYWLPRRVNANSGVYLHGCWEIQILDDFGQPAAKNTTGALYNEVAPSKNASKPAEEWQTLDITFVAPKGGKAGRVTVVHNGEKVIDEAPVLNISGLASEWLREGDLGPVMLQDHGSPVRFRNIRVRPLPDPKKKP
ncbi:MAG: DUF1080 domain-containing protein [Planctomycetes bacterium]|nr:DUF1080 domain-containing protein [Planctomycetota bacterium]